MFLAIKKFLQALETDLEREIVQKCEIVILLSFYIKIGLLN